MVSSRAFKHASKNVSKNASRQATKHASPASLTRAPDTRREAFAIAAPGLAPLVAAELEALGVQVQGVEPAGVAFSATPRMLFRVNCWSRLATRVVMRLDTFTARDFATLEKLARRVPWGDVLRAGDVAELSVTCRKSRLYHSDAVAQRIARGIERMVPGVRAAQADNDDESGEGDEVAAAIDVEQPEPKRDHGKKPKSANRASGPADARVQRILVRFDRDVCTISADASGELLHRRGWRLDTGKAPLRETLAAALIAASEWQGDVPLVDPMCGAGTIAIEAALRARNIAPGLSRSFSCEFWPGVASSLAHEEREAARAAVRDAAAPIVAADRDAGAVEATRTNAERAGVLQSLTVLHQPLSDTDASALGPSGFIVTNPPYGVRTGDPLTLSALWGRLGAMLRSAGPGWRLTAVVPDPALAKELRLPLDRVVMTTTGGRQVAFMRSRAPRGSRTPRATDTPREPHAPDGTVADKSE